MQTSQSEAEMPEHFTTLLPTNEPDAETASSITPCIMIEHQTSLRESADCTGRTLAARCTVDGTYRYPRSQASRETRGKIDLDDGAVEELLFGWFEDRNREGRKQRSCRWFQSSFSPSIYLNQLSLSRDINYPIFSDQINIFTKIFHIVHCATDNDSLRARMMSSY
jgi:hypothetical protein